MASVSSKMADRASGGPWKVMPAVPYWASPLPDGVRALTRSTNSLGPAGSGAAWGGARGDGFMFSLLSRFRRRAGYCRCEREQRGEVRRLVQGVAAGSTSLSQQAAAGGTSR